MVVGDTVMVVPLFTKVPEQAAPFSHCQLAPVPKEPPLTVRLTVLPEHISLKGASLVADVGAVDGVFKVIVTSSYVGVQLPAVIVQRNVFMPVLSPLTLEVSELALVNIPLPAITVQVPVAGKAILAERFAKGKHTDWSGPALAAGGVTPSSISPLQSLSLPSHTSNPPGWQALQLSSQSVLLST